MNTPQRNASLAPLLGAIAPIGFPSALVESARAQQGSVVTTRAWEDGMRQLERWDSGYRGARQASWDTGRPSTELSNAIDVIFDRGCYHGVRRQNAAGYVQTLRRLSQPGMRILILAGNANEPPPHYGSPRVTEEGLRSDFSDDFEIEWLRERRFDPTDPQRPGALAWSILLRRTEGGVWGHRGEKGVRVGWGGGKVRR